jgi:hypothetical protein
MFMLIPNPVRPGYVGTIKIAGLIDKATVKITDIAEILSLKPLPRVELLSGIPRPLENTK